MPNERTVFADCPDIVVEFIRQMGYLENDDILGVILYGSFLTNYYDPRVSDIDVLVVKSDRDMQLIRGIKHIGSHKVEYFEKPISDLYASADNDFGSQDNALVPIVGKGTIVFDNGDNSVKKLQDYILQKFSYPLPPLGSEQAKEGVSILRNRMTDVEKAMLTDLPNFNHLVHLTAEKIMKFYHRLKGYPKIPTSKVYRLYTDEEYARTFGKGEMPDEKFRSLYLATILSNKTNKQKLAKLIELFDFATNGILPKTDDYRIKINTRNYQFW